MLSTVGQELVTGQDRFTFGISDLTLGVELVALVVGLYGITEIMSVIESLQKQVKPLPVRLRDMFPTRQEWGRSVAPFGRGTLLGFLFGLLPGPSATMASFASYRLEKGVSKHKAELGEGAIEGVAGPESANNAAAQTSFIPLLTLGIPPNAVMALMVGAMTIQFEALALTAIPGMRLVTYLTEPASSSADALNVLRSWAAEPASVQIS